MNPPELIVTGDGSHTLYLPDLEETYHSIHGAIQESMHVFVRMGLNYLVEKGNKEIKILEVGMGTGLNVLLTLIESEKRKLSISLTTLEPFPLDFQLIRELNYTENSEERIKEAFENIHICEWGKPVKLIPEFSFQKHQLKISDYEFPGEYDLIYFDAFAPSKQKEIWNPDIIRKLAGMMKKQGILVTYCASGQFKRNLGDTGFDVESLPGPPGKYEMVRATRIN